MEKRANPTPVFGFVLLLLVAVGCAENKTENKAENGAESKAENCAANREAVVSKFDSAIEDLIAEGFPQEIETHLNSLGTSELGYRLGGTSSDNAGAEYLAERMREMGLSHVRLEPVPVDVWEVKGASVTVDGRTMTCSQFPAVRPTPAGGITAEVVYVEGGAAANYEGVDVEGKIVLVDLNRGKVRRLGAKRRFIAGPARLLPFQGHEVLNVAQLGANALNGLKIVRMRANHLRAAMIDNVLKIIRHLAPPVF